MTQNTLREFISAVFRLASAGQWELLRKYLLLVSKIMKTPILTVRLGKPKDKEIS